MSKKYGLFIGRSDLDDTTQGEFRRVGMIYRHKEFDSDTFENDIALIRLAQPSQQALVERTPAAPPAGLDAYVIGWGRLEYGGAYPKKLQEVDVEVIADATCKRAYSSERIASGMFCAHKAGKGACHGDSGGPLFEKRENGAVRQYGIVTKGHRCAEKYGIYTSVAAHSGWIDCVMDARRNDCPTGAS